MNELEAELQTPAVLSSPEKMAELSREYNRKREIADLAEGMEKTHTSVVSLKETLVKETDPELRQMTEDELKKYWLALVFQGKAEAPAFFNTVSELQSFVSENPGAIGIIDQTPPASGIQVVSIDGKKTL